MNYIHNCNSTITNFPVDYPSTETVSVLEENKVILQNINNSASSIVSEGINARLDQPIPEGENTIGGVKVVESVLPLGASTQLLQEVINTNITNNFSRTQLTLDKTKEISAALYTLVSSFLDIDKPALLFESENIEVENEMDTPVVMNSGMGAMLLHCSLDKEAVPMNLTLYTSMSNSSKENFSVMGEKIRLIPGSYQRLNIPSSMKFVYIKISPVSVRSTSKLSLALQKIIF
ncbi:MAG: hypothetical protein J6Y02_04925 [Pseudobutyrivibrio sp.]|nr:hypothetical protein [Pseudobutyrivibrio sp.]